ncbi:MAG: hypothetical protein EA382_05175 [Spirochaetaceae bacterium]|nr:MAG: hypothetical protein EA382_05175 [Spirochaetaceae bacterium]
MSGGKKTTSDAHPLAYPAVLAAAILLFLLPAQGVWAFGIRERPDEKEPENERVEQPDEPEAADASSSGEGEPAEPAQAEATDDGGPSDEGDTNGDVITVDDFALRIERPPIAFDNPRDARRLAIQIEADRRLLNELRKQIPDERVEAELFLKRIRELAAISDPVFLVPLANNVIRQAPLLFEWLETEYEDPDERIRDYYIGGSWAFHRRYEAFRNAVMVTVIRRLDAVGDYMMEQSDGRRR